MTTYGVAPRARTEPKAVLRAVLTLVAALLIAVTAAWSSVALVVATLALQAVVVLAWLALTETEGAVAATAVAAGAAVGADLLAVRRHGDDIAATVGVVAVAFVAALGAQLLRRDRERVTDALGGTITAVVLVVFAAHLLAASARTGRAVVSAAVLCAGVALVAARAMDVAYARPALAPGATRGVLGAFVGVVAATAIGGALGDAWAPLSGASGALLALAVACAAIAADLALDLTWLDALDERRASALDPLTVLLPLVAAAPVAYAAARLLIG